MALWVIASDCEFFDFLTLLEAGNEPIGPAATLAPGLRQVVRIGVFGESFLGQT